MIKNLILNCHGSPGHLSLGQGIGQADIYVFRGIGSLVEKIWIRACCVAGRNDQNQRLGNDFCSGLARSARCYVVASTELQIEYTHRFLPYGQLDSFEGLVLTYGPNGNLSLSQRFPSTYRRVPGDNTSWYRNSD